MHSGTAVLAIVVLSLAACTEANPTPAISIRDSAGIQIIVNNLEQLGATCDISAEPNVSIGDENAGEEYQLHRVFGATRMSDGRIAVVNSGTQQLRFYDRNGRFVSQTGFEMGKARPVADEFPAFGRIAIGRDGRLWVREFRRPSDPRPLVLE